MRQTRLLATALQALVVVFAVGVLPGIKLEPGQALGRTATTLSDESPRPIPLPGESEQVDSLHAVDATLAQTAPLVRSPDQRTPHAALPAALSDGHPRRIDRPPRA
jgi:hypothetical protein